MNIAFPFSYDARGRTVEADDDAHIRQMLIQLMLTRPGERVMRPDFGSGLLHGVFAPNSVEMASALEFGARASIQRYLGDLINVRNLTVSADEEQLHVEVDYEVRLTGAQATASIELKGPAS